MTIDWMFDDKKDVGRTYWSEIKRIANEATMSPNAVGHRSMRTWICYSDKATVNDETFMHLVACVETFPVPSIVASTSIHCHTVCVYSIIAPNAMKLVRKLPTLLYSSNAWSGGKTLMQKNCISNANPLGRINGERHSSFA